MQVQKLRHDMEKQKSAFEKEKRQLEDHAQELKKTHEQVHEIRVLTCVCVYGPPVQRHHAFPSSFLKTQLFLSMHPTLSAGFSHGCVYVQGLKQHETAAKGKEQELTQQAQVCL